MFSLYLTSFLRISRRANDDEMRFLRTATRNVHRDNTSRESYRRDPYATGFDTRCVCGAKTTTEITNKNPVLKKTTLFRVSAPARPSVRVYFEPRAVPWVGLRKRPVASSRGVPKSPSQPMGGGARPGRVRSTGCRPSGLASAAVSEVRKIKHGRVERR